LVWFFADGTPACQLANDPQGQHADEPRASTEECFEGSSFVFADGTPACQIANDPKGQHADEPRASTEALF
jgi:hypothetical protein